MNEKNTYVPPDIWKWDKPSGGAFESINKPTAGASFDQDLPRGEHPLQLYSQGTPNGVKITLMLEELLALGHKGAEYDAWLCRINKGEQFSSGFVEINPNSKIPALLDQSDGEEQLDESDLPRSERPTIIERGKKFAAYDKNGRLIILGYNRQIIQEYADAQSKIRLERQRQD